MLDQVPLEILGMIVHKVADQVDLKHLCEVSKGISDVAIPRLYESIILHTGDKNSLEDLKEVLENMPLHKLDQTKHVHFKSPLRVNLRKRCRSHPLPALERVALIAQDRFEGDPFFKLHKAMGIFLRHLEDDQLLSFSWDVGMCFPNDSFQEYGILYRKQTRLENLSIITDGSCVDGPWYPLTGFEHLKSLSWLGLNKWPYFDSFEDFVVDNKPGVAGLQSLTLDFIEWVSAERFWYEHQRSESPEGVPYRPVNFFAEILLGLPPDDSDISEMDEDKSHEEANAVLFKSLNTLSLSAVSFESAEESMIHALNIVNLRSLKLINCYGCISMLEFLSSFGQSIALKSFELVIDFSILDNNESRLAKEDQDDSIQAFFGSFLGLEDIFLMLNVKSWALSHSLLRSISYHSKTLKRLVVHERGVEEGSETTSASDGNFPWIPDLGDLLSSPSVISFGCIISLPELRRGLEPLVEKPKLKILHLRSSGIDRIGRSEPEPLRTNLNSSPDSRDRNVGLGEEYDSEAADDQDVTSQIEQAQGNQYSRTLNNLTDRSLDNYSYKNFVRARAIAGGTFEEINWSTHFLPFAKWVFSLEGLPDLRILAFGDFSKNGRWADQNILLCRDENLPETRGRNFRALRDSDSYYWDLIDANMDMLAACPADRIMHD